MNAAINPQRQTIVLDCPDVAELADFYAKLLGWTVHGPYDDEWANVVPPEGSGATFGLACQQVEHYRAPEWPDGAVPQQMHLDFDVESLAEACAAAEACGAVRHAVQPSETGSFVVYSDPAGHLFCLCQWRPEA